MPSIRFADSNITPTKVADIVARHIANGNSTAEIPEIIEKHELDYLSMHQGESSVERYRNAVAKQLREKANEHYSKHGESIVNTLLHSVATIAAAGFSRTRSLGWLRHGSGVVALGLGVRTAQKGSSIVDAWMHSNALHDVADEIAPTTSEGSGLRDALKVLQTHMQR